MKAVKDFLKDRVSDDIPLNSLQNSMTQLDVRSRDGLGGCCQSFKIGHSEVVQKCETKECHETSEASVRDILSRFADRTSLPAATFLTSNNKVATRVLWTIILLSMLGGLSYHLCMLIQSFLSYPKFTEVSLGFQPLQFPAITICNVNPMRKNKLYMASQELQDMVKDVEPLKIAKRLIRARLIYNDVKEIIQKTGLDATVNGATREVNDFLNKAGILKARGDNEESAHSSDQTQTITPENTPPVGLNDNHNYSYSNGKETAMNSRQKRSFLNQVARAFRDFTKRTTTPTAATKPQVAERQETPGTKDLAHTENLELNMTLSNQLGLSDGTSLSNGTSFNDSNTDDAQMIAFEMDVNANASDSQEEDRKFVPFYENLGLKFRNGKWQAENDVLGVNKVFKDFSVSTAIIDEFRYLFSREKRSTRIELGHQIENMLIDCSFDGNQCYPSNFTLQTSSSFGNCFTLDHTGLVERRSGPRHGLTLLLFLEQSLFLTGVTSASGGHLVMHPRNSLSFPETEGMAVPAGMEVDVALKLTCQHLCEQGLALKVCGCYRDDFEETAQTIDLSSYHVCASDEEFRCLIEVREKILNQEFDCHCKNPCSEMAFSKSLSMRQWPSREYALILMESVCQRLSKEECTHYKTLKSDQFALSFIKLNIYYEDLNYENITEKPSYKFTQFCSDLGGTLGLWLGLSIITLFEFCHLILSLGRVALACLHIYP